MHSKVKSSFFLTLFAIVLSACGVTPSSSSSPSSQTPSSSQTPTSSASSSTAPSSQETVTVTFDAKGGSAVAPVTVNKNAQLAAPTAPTRAGYTFEGWFRGKAGLTWLEPTATAFPLTATANTTFFAYWEPINSKTINYATGETYYSTLSSTAQRFILNPMTYETGAENDIMSSLSTSLYSSEVDWDKAIEQGVAEFKGDFSKIEAKEFSVESLDFITILQGAETFPQDIEGNDYTLPGGKYDRDNATKVSKTDWIFNLREDMFFEDGLQVTASTFEYTLKQFLDPVQNNFRSTSYYKDADNRSGIPILNASQYKKQTAEAPVPWSDVGFSIIDNFTFKLTTFEAIPQSSAVGFGNIQLVHPTIFASSLNGSNSTYGTPANPFVSYGPYLIKSWNENQSFVLNKNFNFVRKDTITYKSISYAFTATVEENMNLFENGSLSSVGLIGQYYTQYADNPNVKRAWQGYPSYLIVNTAPSSLETNAHQKHPIVQDERFRQALFFGFNRAAYTSTVYAPNAPSVLPVPVDTKGYIQDPLYYSESPNHLENLEEFGISEGTNGYIPERAIQLFNAALTDYLASPGAVAGPVTLKYLISNNALNVSLAAYIKSMYETLFNTDPANPDKLIINVVAVASSSLSAIRAAWDFDLLPINLGFGVSYGVWWQYAAFGLIGGAVVPQFGLNIPFAGGRDAEGNTIEIDLRDDPESWIMENVDVDLTTTYDFLLELGEEVVFEEDENGDYVLPGFAWLLEQLEPTEGKAAGIYRGSIYALAEYVYNESTPWDASAAEPFPGSTEEVWKVTAVFEKAFLAQMPLVPMATLDSAVVYAANVMIEWPAYSSAFGWGAARYRYLTTDADFANGFYNAYEAAYLATLTA
jgi:oligopeptide transport system substrate-binding protein